MRILGLLAIVVLSLSACNGDGSSDDDTSSATASTAVSRYAPVAQSPSLPFPNDLFFVNTDNQSGPTQGFTVDGTLNLPDPTPGGTPLIRSLDMLDGFSTSESLYADFEGQPIDMASANDGGIRLINLETGQALVAGTDFQVVKSSVSVDDQRLLIQPLTPLASATTYAVLVTTALKTENGQAVRPSRQFRIVSSASRVGSSDNPASDLSRAQQVALEVIRQGSVRPLLTSVGAQAKDTVVAWRFTTQSIGDSLRYIADHPTPNPDHVADGGLRVEAVRFKGIKVSTGLINSDLPDTADLYQGTVDLSYYLADDDSNNRANDGQTPLKTYWKNNGVQADGRATLRGLDGERIACADIQPGQSTTGCYPQPEQRSVQSVPVLISVPNRKSPSRGRPPAAGWPVVIFQHGLTGNRTNLITIAPELANAGFVAVAIDLPLHGVMPDNPLYVPGKERTFNLDANGDGMIDASGINFFNLRNPITARDNSRQAVADLIDLAAMLRRRTITVERGRAIPINGRTPQYFGHSLGGVVGGTLLGVTDDQTIGAATLANPGGGLIRMLDGSSAFGPIFADGLGSIGIDEKSNGYQALLRLSQTVYDAGDPINYAAAAGAAHPIQMIEVVGGGNNGQNPPDLILPNAVPANVGPAAGDNANGACPATLMYTADLDTICVGAPLSGTDPMASVMGLARVTAAIPFKNNPQPAGTIVGFTSGTHRTALDPIEGGDDKDSGVDPEESALTTREMKCESAAFLAAAAAGNPNPIIPIGCSNR